MTGVRRGRRLAGWGSAAVVAGLLAASPAAALDNGLARTPPMGWNTYYAFNCRFDEPLLRSITDSLVSSGMRAAGYRYVNLDDCWMRDVRGPGGELMPDPVKFPGGLRPLADYVHARGLRFGIYMSTGSLTCAMFPGSLGHFERDIAAFATWGVDFVKADWCRAAPGQREPVVFAQLRDAIRRTGRPMVLSVSESGRSRPWTWGPRTANLWRTTTDNVSWLGDPARPWPSLMQVVDANQRLARFARPGAWNDPDILPVGNPGLTDTEGRSIFSLWSMMAAPLIAGNDLRAMSAATRRILTNREVIAVDQDRAGIQGRRWSRAGPRELWVRSLAGGQRAVLLFNRGPRPAVMTADARRLGLAPAAVYLVRDLWAHRTTTTRGPIRATVAGHGVAMFRVRRAG